MTKATIVRSVREIDDVLNKADEFESKYPGMTYEQGIHAMYRWLVGEDDENPIE